MDTEYLKASVGDALKQGLSAVAVKQPDDPVEFLGNFLVAYVDTKEKEIEAQLVIENAKMEEAAAKASAEGAAEAAAQKEAKAEKKAAEQEQLEQDLATTPDVVGQYDTLLSMLQSETGATSCYLGRKETRAGEPETTQVQYVAATPNNKFLVGQTLTAPSEDPDSSTDGVGVTFNVWKPVEGVDEEGNPTSVDRDMIHIKNVVRSQEVKFYGVPKLGAYCAVPFTYESYIHPDVFEPVADESTPPAEGEEGEPVEEKINTMPIQMVCAMDSMGQGREFSEEEISVVKKWAALIGSNLTRAESEVFAVEKKARDAANEANKKRVETLEAGKEATDAKMKEEIEEKLKTEQDVLPEGEELSESVQQLFSLVINTRYAMEQVVALQDVLVENMSWSIGPKQNVMKVLECVLYLLGYTKEQFYDMASQKPDWSNMRGLFGNEWLEKLRAYNATETPATPSYADIGSLQALINDHDDAAISAISVVYSALLNWAKCAVHSREKVIAKKEADAEAAAS